MQNVDGHEVKLNICSVNGHADYDALRAGSYPGTDVFVVHFQVNHPESFDLAATKWVPEIRQCCPNVPILLLGTSIEKRDDAQQRAVVQQKYGRGCITKEEGEKKAKEIGAFDYLECSALLIKGLKEVFEAVARVTVCGNSNESETKPKNECVIC